jgi:hypothetical protein
MSRPLINQYRARLDVLKKVGGTPRESVVREAFKDLFKAGPDWRPRSAAPRIAPSPQPSPPRTGARVNAWLNHVAHQEAG